MSIELSKFSDNDIIYSLASKLKTSLEKGASDGELSRITKLLIQLLRKRKNTTKASYLLSLIAEQNPYELSLIYRNIIVKLLEIEKAKTRVNLAIILGEYILINRRSSTFEEDLEILISLINDSNSQVRNNAIIYLLKLNSIDSKYLSHPKFIKHLLELHSTTDDTTIKTDLRTLLNTQPILFLDQYNKLIPNTPKNMLKTDLTDYLKFRNIRQDEFFAEYFKYIKTKNTLYIVSRFHSRFHPHLIELKQDSFEKFYTQDKKLSPEMINIFFCPIFSSSHQVRKLMKILIIQKILKGYYSNTGFYYSTEYFVKLLLSEVNAVGKISLEAFSHYPKRFLFRALTKIQSKYHIDLLWNTKNTEVYSFSKIITSIASQSHNSPIINFNHYHVIFNSKDYEKLLELSKNRGLILEEYEHNNIFLTTMGKNLLTNYLTDSKQIGKFSTREIYEATRIPEEISILFFRNHTDPRIGLYNKSFTLFYYNSYLNRFIRDKSFQDVIKVLAKMLGKAPEVISEQLNRNRLSLIKEIDEKKEVSIHEYTEKLGVSQEGFVKLLNTRKLVFLKQGDTLLFDTAKIDQEKRRLKQVIIELTQNEDDFELNEKQFKLPETFAYDITRKLLENKKIKGMLYRDHESNKFRFITENGLKTTFEENKYKISLRELFPEKKIYLEIETELINNVIKELIKEEKLTGEYSEESMKFISTNLRDAETYPEIVNGIVRKGEEFISYYETGLRRIFRILKIRERILTPKQIERGRNIIENIVKNHKKWFDEFDAIIHRTIQHYKEDKKISKNSEVITVKKLTDNPQIKELTDLLVRYRAKLNRLAVKYDELLYLRRKYFKDRLNFKLKSKFEKLLQEFKPIESRIKPRDIEKRNNIYK
ncbi:MAG: hypothetical protein GF311_25855 [Candidatus Lokiarchaeota archaeon]|nr:hypothetical protein [Candidatus Lokiarchaeota archaeon]